MSEPMPGIGTEAGMVGIFTRNEESGAIKNGTVIRKRQSETGDQTPDGTVGVVLGSVSADGVDTNALAQVPENLRDFDFGYFVEWQTMPKCAVLVIGSKIEEVN